MRYLLSLVFVLTLLLVRHGNASQIQYSFSGVVSFVAANPYGIPVTPAGSSVTGQFRYDQSSPATNTFTGGTGYAQHSSNGFTATVGGINLHTDDYVVSVFDDLKQPNNSLADLVSVTFSNQLGLPANAALVANNVAHTAGLLKISFLASSSLFTGTALPGLLNPSVFTSTSGLLSDVPTGLVDVLFTAGSSLTITSVSEPSSGLLLWVGATASIGLRRTALRRRMSA